MASESAAVLGSNNEEQKMREMKARAGRAIGVDNFMTGVFYVVAGFFLALLIALASYIIIKGFAGAKPYMFAFDSQGIGNQFWNTIYLVFLSLLISVPIGVMAGIYMALYAKKGRVATILRIAIETLSSLPSIVVGLFGYLVFIVMTGNSWNLFAGALAVSILSLPLIATTTEDAINMLPDSYTKGAFGMGATKRQVITTVLLPAATPHIITGVILAAGRGFGEAAALLYTAGMSTDLNWHMVSAATNPFNPFRPGETLALNIWALRTEALRADAAEMANLSSAILMILVLGFSLLAHTIERHMKKKSGV